MTCRGDNPATLKDEGAVAGDIVTFYIDGIKQQKQAIWKPGKAVRADLGIAVEGEMFNLHLVDMPGYSNYEDKSNYSGVAVADMILDYLDPDNPDTQPDLMVYADKDSNEETSAPEIEKLLNDKAPLVYNFGSTMTLNTYSEWGFIDSFNAANQNDSLNQLCHWLSYKIPNAPSGKEYVPVAVCTSANPAASVDSDYNHWMSVVGIKTNKDPFPGLSDSATFRENYHVPESLELLGIYINDPAQTGLGFHSYISIDEWNNKYFRPIAGGFKEEGKYIAIMEPPDPQAMPVKASPAQSNDELQTLLEIPQSGISIFMPGWVNTEVKDYLMTIFNNFKDSPEFNFLIQDSYFARAFKNVEVNRCYKVDGRLSNDYTLVPFEKKIDGKLVTTSAVVVNNETGQLRIVSVEPEASEVFNPMSLISSYRGLRKHIGWKRWEYPINYWLSNSVGSALFPGWNTVTVTVDRQKSLNILKTSLYTVIPKGEIFKESNSPRIEVLDVQTYRSEKNWIKLVLFRTIDSEKCVVTIDKAENCTENDIFRNEDRNLVILKGGEKANCRIMIRKTDISNEDFCQGGVTYLYVGK